MKSLRIALVVLLSAALALVVPAAARAAGPTVTLGAARVQPGDTLTVSGSGFGPNERVDLYFDLTDVAFVATDATGAFARFAITVPSSATSATHWVSAEGHHSGLFAQAPVIVNVNWAQGGFGSSNRHANPLENTLGAGNVDQLEAVWSQQFSPFGNPTPLIEYNGAIFTNDIQGSIRSFSSTGKMLWKASQAAPFPAVAPAAYNNLVFFGGGDGTVSAFGAACKSDGSTCTAKWTHSVGTEVTGNLTVNAGVLYAPSADGTVHALDPATGSELGTPLGIASATAAGTLTFVPNLSWQYPQGAAVLYKLPCCASTNTYNYGSGVYVGPIAATGGVGIFFTSDGNLRAFGTKAWADAIPGAAGCTSTPAIGNGYAYAGGCTTLGAYNTVTGATRWQITTSYVSGVTVANGVVYACVGNNGAINAYDARYGSLLWSGGDCADAPVVVNGMLYATANGAVTAYAVGGGSAASVARPTAAQLG